MGELMVETVKRMAINPIADLIHFYITRGTAEDLERAITDGWSLVNQVKKEPKDQLMAEVDAVLENYPLMSGAMKAARRIPSTDAKVEGSSFLAGLDVNQLVTRIIHLSPDYGQVLSRHLDWVESEVMKVQELLN